MNNTEDIFTQEPLSILKKQAINVATKIKFTVLMLPGDRQQAIDSLRQWDLWGPLFICTIFAFAIGLQAQNAYAYQNFINVFLIFWVGAVLVSINCRLLGNKGSIFQSVSVIGYCMLPIAVLGLIIALLPSSTPSFVNLIIILLGLLWSTVSCLIVMGDLISTQKRFLCGYPILLFYIYLSWYAVVS